MPDTMIERITEIITEAMLEERANGRFSSEAPAITARVVLAAMREPTLTMTTAGDQVVDRWPYGHTVATSELSEAYTAMIDAATGEA